MIHVVLADDEVLARQKLRLLLRSEAEIEIVGEGATGAETIELVRVSRPEQFANLNTPADAARYLHG